MSVRNVVLILAVIGCAIWPTEPTATANAKTAHKEARQEALQLLEAGNYDQALSAYGIWGHALRQQLFRKTCDAVRDLGAEEALPLYEAYFQHYPFGHLDWDSDWWSWSNIACDYTELREQSGRGADGQQAVQDVAAMETYRTLLEYRWKCDQGNCAKLADQIVDKYPLSLFCPAAVLSAGNLAQHGGVPSAIRTYEEYLAKMREAGSPERSRIVVMLQYANTCVRYAKSEQEQRKSLSTYLEIAQMTDITYEKQLCLLKAAHAALRIGDQDSLELSRSLFREFLAKYPDALEATEARLGVVGSYLAAGQHDEALRALHELEQSAPPGTDFAEDLLAIWQAHFDAGDYERSLALLEWLTQLLPQASTAAMGYIRMGETYDKLGEEEKMVASYKKAAGSSPGQGWAVKSLADYYTEKGQWAEALKWWEAWQPVSDCGTGWVMAENHRAHKIAVCQMKIGLLDDALRTMESWVFEKKLHCGPDIPIMLVDFYRQRAGPDAVEKRLRDASAQSELAKGGRIALQYIDLIHMAERKDLEALWEFLDHLPFPSHSIDWKTEKAADLLVSIPDAAKPFAMAKLDGDVWDISWALVLLARVGAQEIFPTLKEKIQAEKNVHVLGNYFYALALLGTDAAYAVIAHHAAHSTGNHRTAAQNVLKEYPPP